MKIEREYRPNLVSWQELEFGQVFSDASDSEASGLYLYIGMDEGVLHVFDLDTDQVHEIYTQSHPQCLIRKVKLVVED